MEDPEAFVAAHCAVESGSREFKGAKAKNRIYEKRSTLALATTGTPPPHCGLMTINHLLSAKVTVLVYISDENKGKS